jgi:hypothetical protein
MRCGITRAAHLGWHRRGLPFSRRKLIYYWDSACTSWRGCLLSLLFKSASSPSGTSNLHLHPCRYGKTQSNTAIHPSINISLESQQSLFANGNRIAQENYAKEMENLMWNWKLLPSRRRKVPYFMAMGSYQPSAVSSREAFGARSLI